MRSVVGGSSCGIVLVLSLAGLYFYSQQPKGWNKKALRAGHVKAEPITRLNEQFKDVGLGATFTADLENTTSADITVPQSVTVMQEDKHSHALHQSFLKLDRDVFIPSRHIVTISLTASDICSPKNDPQGCFKSYFEDDDQIVLLDEVAKYEIRLPIPALTVRSGIKFELPK